jgi:hypothetical protein
MILKNYELHEIVNVYGWGHVPALITKIDGDKITVRIESHSPANREVMSRNILEVSFSQLRKV